MNKLRYGLIGVSILVIAYALSYEVNYTDLSWSKNTSAYLKLGTFISVAVSMVISIRHTEKSNN